MPEPLLQCSYMPGDSFAIAAYLALKPSQKLILLKDTTLVDDKYAFISGLYRETGVAGQVTEIDLPPLWRPKLRASPAKEVYRLWSEKRLPDRPDRFVDRDATKQGVIRAILTAVHAVDKQWPRGVTTVTGWLANAVKGNCDARLTDVLNKWKIATLTKQWSKDFDTFLSARGLTKLKAASLVLWSRQSGKKQGAHLELDSGFYGIRQITQAFDAKCDGKHSIILVGDDKQKDTSTKLQQIATTEKCAYLGEFWKTREWQEKFSENRIAQLAFWIYLNAKHKLVHLGMRSGNLEAMSLLKMPVIYLEPKDSGSGDRMTAFAEAGIPYERLQIGHSPGLTGRWAADYEQHGERPAKTHNFAQDVSSEANRIKRYELSQTQNDIVATAKARDQAYKNRQWQRVGELKTQVNQLKEQKDAIAQTDYSASARLNVKEWDPANKAYTRARGFDPTDVDKIVTAALSKF